MSIYKIATIASIIVLFFASSSCKKSGKEVLEKITAETVEKTAKEVSEEVSEKTLKNLTKKELRSLDWGDLLKIIRKENINLADALSRLDGSFQKKPGKRFKRTMNFI